MIKAGKLIGCTLSASVLCCTFLRAATPGAPKSSPGETGAPSSASTANPNPYQGIVDRNVFGLKPPPPPPAPPEPPKPPVNITLTGITTVLGKKRCFITVTASPKPGAPAVPISMMLTEDQRDGEIEISHIDPEKGVVDLKQGGSPVTISFKENGVKGGPPAMAGGLPTLPNPQPNPFTPATYPGQKTIPGRPLRIPTPGQQNGYNSQPGMNQPGGSTSTAPPQNSPQFTIHEQTPNMSAEESEILIAAEHQRAVANKDGTAA